MHRPTQHLFATITIHRKLKMKQLLCAYHSSRVLEDHVFRLGVRRRRSTVHQLLFVDGTEASRARPTWIFHASPRVPTATVTISWQMFPNACAFLDDFGSLNCGPMFAIRFRFAMC